MGLDEMNLKIDGNYWFDINSLLFHCEIVELNILNSGTIFGNYFQRIVKIKILQSSIAIDAKFFTRNLMNFTNL